MVLTSANNTTLIGFFFFLLFAINVDFPFILATRMDLSSVRRVSSAGYRLPERTRGTRPVSTEPPAERTRRGNKRDPASPQLDQDRIDTVKQDQVWKDVVWNERRGVQEW